MSREYVVMDSFLAGETFDPTTPAATGTKLGDMYKAVVLGPGGRITVPSAANSRPIGVLNYFRGGGGTSCQVATFGRTKGQVGGAFTAGDLLSVDENGRFVTGGSKPVAIARQTVVAGDVGAAADISFIPTLA